MTSAPPSDGSVFVFENCRYCGGGGHRPDLLDEICPRCWGCGEVEITDLQGAFDPATSVTGRDGAMLPYVVHPSSLVLLKDGTMAKVRHNGPISLPSAVEMLFHSGDYVRARWFLEVFHRVRELGPTEDDEYE